MSKTLKEVLSYTGKVLPIITEHLTQEQAIKTAQAVYKGGARAIEFTLRTENAEREYINKETFDKIRKACPKMLIGVGTCDDEKRLDIAKAAGADFAVAATYSEPVILHAKTLGLPYVPNVTDAQMVQDIRSKQRGHQLNFDHLHERGVTGFKVAALSNSPCASLDNAGAILGILGGRSGEGLPDDFSIICTEDVKGINQHNMDKFPFCHKNAAGIGGTWMWKQLDKKGEPYSLIQAGDYKNITLLTRHAIRKAELATLSPGSEGYASKRGTLNTDEKLVNQYFPETLKYAVNNGQRVLADRVKIS